MTREEELAKEIKEYADKGYSSTKMSIEMNVDIYVINKIMKKYDIRRNSIPLKRIFLDEKKVIKLYTEEKLSVTTISKRFNVSIYTIRRILIDNHLIIPKRKNIED